MPPCGWSPAGGAQPAAPGADPCGVDGGAVSAVSASVVLVVAALACLGAARRATPRGVLGWRCQAAAFLLELADREQEAAQVLNRCG